MSRSSSYLHSVHVHGRVLAALSISQRSRTRSGFGSSLYLIAFSYTVGFWQLSLFRSVLIHGRTLAALSISQRSRTRLRFGSSLNWQRSRTRLPFGSSLYFAAFSYTVALWQLSLFCSVLVHGRNLAALSISQRSRRSCFVSSLNWHWGTIHKTI